MFIYTDNKIIALQKYVESPLHKLFLRKKPLFQPRNVQLQFS